MFGFEQRGKEQNKWRPNKTRQATERKKLTKENHVIETKIFGTWNY